MKNQIGKTILQIIAGAAVVVIGLIALNKYVPTFTLFPKTVEVQQQQEKESEENIPKMDEATPADMPQDNNSSDFNETEDATSPKPFIPENVLPNVQYALDKRLRAGNLGFVSPNDLERSLTVTFTQYLHTENCPKNVDGYKKNIAINFTLGRDDLAEVIHFVAVRTAKNYYAFKPQQGNNLLIIPNNFTSGTHEITYGFVLKSDVNKKEVPFHARKCEISVR
jgi:hypothetical protein